MNRPREPDLKSLLCKRSLSYDHTKQGAVSTPDVGVHWELQQKPQSVATEGSGI